jgi:3-oxoacyl-[acyl-carrier-protein] synthase II
LAFAEKALSEALSDSKIDLETERCVGIVMGTSLGNFEFLEKTIKNRKKTGRIIDKEDAKNWQRGCLGNIAAEIAKKYKIDGPKFTISTACAAGTNSISYAYELIRTGLCDVVITGGTDSIYSISYTGFSSLMSLTAAYVKPFDEKRDGLALGEGAGILILESEQHAIKRKAHIYAEVAGYAINNNAYHVTSPDPEGKGAYTGMEMCIEKCGFSKNDVDYINTHGTGTNANDISEIRAIRSLFKNNTKPIFVSSNKSLFGHCLGAAGSVEAISTILSICNDFIPPTINTDEIIKPDDENEINKNIVVVLGEKKDTVVNCAISNSFAFGGNIAIIGFKKYEK